MGQKKVHRRALLLALAALLLGQPALPAAGSDATAPPGGQLVEQSTVDLPIQGSMAQRADVISVIVPATIPFLLDVDEAGELLRVLSATGTFTNNSLFGVELTLDSVTDGQALMNKVDLYLAVGSESRLLAEGTLLNIPLATLPGATQSAAHAVSLAVEGEAKPGVTGIGTAGETFEVGVTLKVTKTP